MKKYTAVLVNERQVQNPVCGVYKPWDRVDEDDSEEDSEDEFQNLSFKEMKSSATGGKRLFQRKKQKKVRGIGVIFFDLLTLKVMLQAYIKEEQNRK